MRQRHRALALLLPDPVGPTVRTQQYLLAPSNGQRFENRGRAQRRKWARASLVRASTRSVSSSPTTSCVTSLEVLDPLADDDQAAYEELHS
jgi:hypothetical protein